MTNKFPGQESRLKDYCAVSAFVQVLLVNGYGFGFLSFPHISFQKKVGRPICKNCLYIPP